MELFEAIGSRRSIRYFKPYQPVERWKVEMIFQAARRSSRAVNASFIKAVAVERDSLSPEKREQLKTPTTTADLDMAPLYIFTYADPFAPDGGPERLKDLYNRGAFTPALGWSEKFIDEVVAKTILEPLVKDEVEARWIASVEAAQAVAHMLLAAVELGLGVCCKSFNPEIAAEVLKVPPDWHPVWLILVGYPAEDPQAGGQRPRPPLEQDYFWGDCDTPFTTTDEVTETLRQRKLLQPEGPFPWRQDELRFLARGLGLPE
jgi:nitroreductase